MYWSIYHWSLEFGHCMHRMFFCKVWLYTFIVIIDDCLFIYVLSSQHTLTITMRLNKYPWILIWSLWSYTMLLPKTVTVQKCHCPLEFYLIWSLGEQYDFVFSSCVSEQKSFTLVPENKTVTDIVTYLFFWKYSECQF